MTEEATKYVGAPRRHLERLVRNFRKGQPDAHFVSPLARHSLRFAVDATRDFLLQRLQELLADPILVEDEGNVRRVRFLSAIEYSFDRRQRIVECGHFLDDGSWQHFECTSSVLFCVDTFLARPMWRRVVVNGLHRAALDWLGHAGGARRTRKAFAAVCGNIVDRAVQRTGLVRRLRQLRVKDVRKRLRIAFAFDPDVLALARAAQLNPRQASLTQKWLTFVWQNQETLQRIRSQTPTLLAPVAEFMFAPNLDCVGDPTSAFRRWLADKGVTPAAYKLLATRGPRAFRCVIRWWKPWHSLDALVLSLKFSARPNGARALPKPLARATVDVYEWMSPEEMGRRLARLPGRFYAVAQGAFDQLNGDLERTRFVREEYGLVMNWWLEVVSESPAASRRSTWERLVERARDHAERERARIASTTWSSAIESVQIPGVRITALMSTLMLYDEGAHMHHCLRQYADDYAKDCLAGKARVFSVRATIGGIEERATIRIARDGQGWRPAESFGTCNRVLLGRWKRIARELAEEYSRRDTSRPIEEPEPAPRRYHCLTCLINAADYVVPDPASQVARHRPAPMDPPPPGGSTGGPQ